MLVNFVGKILKRGAHRWCTMPKPAAKPLSLGFLMCSILPCIGLQVLDDGVAAVTLEDAGYESEFVGPRMEHRSPHSSKDSHIGAEHVRQRQQSRLEHINWQDAVRRHVESTGGAFVGYIPDHVIEHLAES